MIFCNRLQLKQTLWASTPRMECVAVLLCRAVSDLDVLQGHY